MLNIIQNEGVNKKGGKTHNNTAFENIEEASNTYL